MPPNNTHRKNPKRVRSRASPNASPRPSPQKHSDCNRHVAEGNDGPASSQKGNDGPTSSHYGTSATRVPRPSPQLEVQNATLWLGEIRVDERNKDIRFHTKRTLDELGRSVSHPSEYTHTAQLTLKVDTPHGHEATVLTLLDSGAFNNVYTFPPGHPRDAVMRISQHALDYDHRCAFDQEVRVLRKLAGLRIAPTIFAVHEFTCGRVGVEMERYDAALDKVEMCPSLARQVFVDHDGESDVIDLYVRASQHIWCIDTRPANVVVKVRRQHRRVQVEMRLIDIDTRYFCTENPFPVVVPTEHGQDWLRAALMRTCTYGFLSPLVGPYTKDDPAAIAVTNVLIHCTDAVRNTRYNHGSPYVKTVTTLLQHLSCCMALSRRCTGMMKKRNKDASFTLSTAKAQLEHYSDGRYAQLQGYLQHIVRSGPFRVERCLVRTNWWRVDDDPSCVGCIDAG